VTSIMVHVNTSQHTEPMAYTVDGACEATGHSRSRIYGAMRSEALTWRQCGSRRLILASDLQRYLESLPVGTTGRAA